MAMLNVRRLSGFKYDVKEILNGSNIDSAYASALLANIIAKASRVSISEAKEYVRGESLKGYYQKEVSDDICSLLDRYAKYR